MFLFYLQLAIGCIPHRSSKVYVNLKSVVDIYSIIVYMCDNPYYPYQLQHLKLLVTEQLELTMVRVNHYIEVELLWLGMVAANVISNLLWYIER